MGRETPLESLVSVFHADAVVPLVVTLCSLGDFGLFFLSLLLSRHRVLGSKRGIRSSLKTEKSKEKRDFEK